MLALLLLGLHHQIIPHVSQTLQHAAIKLLNRIHSWTHIWAWKLSSRRWMPIVWGSPQDSSYLVRRCNYAEVHVSDMLHLNWTITSLKQKVIYKFAFCLEGWITFNVIINHQCVLRGCRLSVCMYLWTSVIRRLTSVVDPVYVLSLRLQCLNHVHR